MPMFSSAATADSPEPLMVWRPFRNSLSACVGSSSHIFLKSSAVRPATVANACRASPPSTTADSMPEMVFPIAVAAASDRWPVDAIAADHARISEPEKLAVDATAASRWATFMIADSCAGMLLPRRTSASEKPCMPLMSSVRTLAICPRRSAMSSASMSVAMSKDDVMRPNCSRSSLRTPSCPPSACISSMVSADVMDVWENFMAASSSPSNSVSVALTVLRMSRYPESMVSDDEMTSLDRRRMALAIMLTDCMNAASSTFGAFMSLSIF